MKYEIVLHWAKCDNEFHYDLFINDLWVCTFCSLQVVFKLLKRDWFIYQSMRKG